MRVVSELEIAAAVNTLGESERGRTALRDLATLLENGAIALCETNQRAVILLLIASWTNHGISGLTSIRAAATRRELQIQF